MEIRWQIADRTRCDIAAYSGRNLDGKRTTMRVFPAGNTRGGLQTDEVRSMVVRAPHGTRLILITRPGGTWQDFSWRCVRVVEGFTTPSEKAGGLPGVRLPDLDLLDEPKARKTNPNFSTTYPSVGQFDEGNTWTFGRVADDGGLKGRIRLIVIEHDDAEAPEDLTAVEVVARAILQAARDEAPGALDALIEVAVTAVRDAIEGPEADDRAASLKDWADTLLDD